MRRIVFGLMGVALSATLASAIVPPAKAKSIKGELVTAYDPCFINPQSETTNPPVVLAACPATEQDSTCQFGSKGAGKYGAGVSKTDVKLSASLGGLVGCDGSTLTAVSDAVVTTTDCTVSGTCTAIIDDFPVGSCVVALGKCSIKTTVETFLNLGTQVFKDGQTVTLELGATCVKRGAITSFCGGIRIGPS